MSIPVELATAIPSFEAGGLSESTPRIASIAPSESCPSAAKRTCLGFSGTSHGSACQPSEAPRDSKDPFLLANLDVGYVLQARVVVLRIVCLAPSFAIRHRYVHLKILDPIHDGLEVVSN